MMRALLEPPALRGFHVNVVVITVVGDFLRVAVEADHQHVHGAARTFRGRRDDVIRIDMTDALGDPRRVAALRSAARSLGEPLAALKWRDRSAAAHVGLEYAVFGIQVRIVVAVVRAGVDRASVLRDELLDLDVVECGELHGLLRQAQYRQGR
jgi:hypothetical protein